MKEAMTFFLGFCIVSLPFSELTIALIALAAVAVAHSRRTT